MRGNAERRLAISCLWKEFGKWGRVLHGANPTADCRVGQQAGQLPPSPNDQSLFTSPLSGHRFPICALFSLLPNPSPSPGKLLGILTEQGVQDQTPYCMFPWELSYTR